MLGQVPFEDVGDRVDGRAAVVIDHALGVAGGAGGVVQRDRVPLVRGHVPSVIRIARSQEGFIVGLAERLRLRPQRIVDRDHLEPRDFQRHLPRKVGKLGVGQQHAGLAMAQHEDQVGGVEADIQRIEHGTRHRHAEMRLHHGRRIGQQRGHGITLADAGPRQRAGQAPRARIGVAPVLAQRAVHDGQALAVHLGGADQEVDGRKRHEVGRVAGQAAVEIGGHCLCLRVSGGVGGGAAQQAA
ncbi:hypothetical protein D9M72_436960 [compost metagenome]